MLSFLLLSGVLWYEWTTIWLTNYQLKDIWVVSSLLGLLPIMLLWTSGCCVGFISPRYMQISVISGSYGNCIFNVVQNRQMFSRVLVPFYIHTSNGWMIQFLWSLISIWCCDYFFYLSRLKDISLLGHLIVIVICIPLMTNEVEHLSCAYLCISPFKCC